MFTRRLHFSGEDKLAFKKLEKKRECIGIEIPTRPRNFFVVKMEFFQAVISQETVFLLRKIIDYQVAGSFPLDCDK